MRKSKTTNGLKVNAISGTYVVLLAFDLPEHKCDGLLGFSIHRLDEKDNDSRYLEGMKAFSETDPGFPSGALYSSKDHPFQSFQWADYAAKPGFTYTYTVTALKGTPKNLTPIASTKVTITTESPESGSHDVYFNRGTAASQEYARRFGNVKPKEVPNNKAYEWLSRGSYEALENFITSCQPGVHQLRVAAYEFTYEPLLRLLKETIDRGVDIKIVYDGRKESTKEENQKKINLTNLTNNAKPRSKGASFISHNKFIIKLENNIPKMVWTGGMNFSQGGIFGHSNVAHVVEETTIANQFHSYWQALHDDMDTRDMKKKVEALTPLPSLPLSDGTTCLFSPRKNLDALNLYSTMANSANEGLFMTFAFGINDIFKEVYKNSNAPLRFALLEKTTRAMEDGPEKDQEIKAIQLLRNQPENVFAIGDYIKDNEFVGWVKESLSGFNRSVNYIHNKFMLIDPLSKNPIVISGSANFSNASTINNDENMVLIKGNKRVADIYLGEYMRLFSHFSFRESLKWRKADDKPKPLKTDNIWWKDYYGTDTRAIRKAFFMKMKK